MAICIFDRRHHLTVKSPLICKQPRVCLDRRDFEGGILLPSFAEINKSPSTILDPPSPIIPVQNQPNLGAILSADADAASRVFSSWNLESKHQHTTYF